MIVSGDIILFSKASAIVNVLNIDPNSKTPMRDQVKTEEYNQLKKKYDINYARNRCVDGLSARLTKKDDL